MTFNHLNRRTHLYLALALLPWFVIYGLSSIFFSHSDWMENYYKDGIPRWMVTGEFAFAEALPPQGEDLHEITDAIGAASDIEGPFASWRPPNGNRLYVFLIQFLENRRLTYYPDQGKVIVEEERFRWDNLLIRLHTRGGFHHYSLLHDVWAVVVDGVCIAFLIWVASGVYMWWLLPATRTWGSVALGGGILSFVIFTFWL